MKINQVLSLLVFLSTIIFHTSSSLFAENQSQISKKIDFLALGTGSTTGTYFPLGNAFSNIWSQKSKVINSMTFSTNGSFENIELLRKRELSLAIAQSDIVNAAINGTGQFEGNKYEDLRVLMSLYSEVIQIVVPEASDIKSLFDLKGHKINVGPANSGNALTTKEVLTAMGIPESDYTKIYLSYDEAIQAMEKSECDATIIISGVPTKAIIELKKRIPIKVLGIPREVTFKTVGKLPYLTQYTIPDNIYGENISTVAVSALLVTNNKLKDNIAYDLLSMLFENQEYLRQIHERANDISPKNAVKGLDLKYLHQGAKKYYQENLNIIE